MTTIQTRVQFAEDLTLQAPGTIVEVFYGDDTAPSERTIHIGDGVVLGRDLNDGEYFTASYDRDGRFVGGSSSRGEFSAEVLQALDA
jgi:hypothetical protein